MRATGLAVASLFLSMTAVAAPPATPTGPAAPSATATPARQDAAIYVYAEDPAAGQAASRASDALHRYAISRGFRSTGDARLGELLDRSTDDLLRAASSLASARAALKEGQDELGRLRLDAAQDALFRANSSYLDAAAAPAYAEMRDVHLYLGVLAQNQGQPDVAQAQFRSVVFFSPQFQLNRNVFPPSVVNAFEAARASVATGKKGSLRVEADKIGAFFFLDGTLKGSIPRILVDVPEGTHYLEVRGPGASPQLLSVQVEAGNETPVSVQIRPATAPVRRIWMEPGGETGATAIARILGVDRIVVATARSTVTGVSPFSVRAASFDLTRRTTTAEISTSRDVSTTDSRLGKLAKEVFRTNQGYSGESSAAASATRRRILAPYEIRVALEAGGAYQNREFDPAGKSIPTTDAGQIAGQLPDHAFDNYTETRTVLHLRYGLRERTTVFLDVPFYSKELVYDFDEDGSGTIGNVPGEVKIKRQDQGMGDITVGTDVRLRSLEGFLSLAYFSARGKLPTGNANAAGYIHQYRHLVIGSGQADLYAGLGGVLARGPTRVGFEAGYNIRLGGYVPYARADNDGSVGASVDAVTKPGDEQKLHLDLGLQAGRWISFEVDADYLHRNSMRNFYDPFSHNFGHTHDMTLLDAGGAIRAELSEKSDIGIVGSYSVYGKSTITLFPLDVTGPRAYAYYGVRF